MRRRLCPIPLVAIGLALVLGACSRSDSGRDAAQRATRAVGDPALCDPAASAVEDGPLTASAPSNGVKGDSLGTDGTGEFVLLREGGCERVSLALTHAGVPGSVPGRLEGRVLRSYGVVRVALPGALATVTDADSLFETPLLYAGYIVHGRDGGYFLDLHLAQPAIVRLLTLATPARIALDLSPGGGAVPTVAPRARNVVVLEPRAGQASYPLTIRGYARTFEANVIGRLLVDGKEKARTFGTAADWAGTWGEFELTVASGPAGKVDLFVGEDSAQDGSPIGVTIPLTIR